MSQSASSPDQSADRLIEALLAALRAAAPGSSFACLNLVDPACGHAIRPVPRNRVGSPCKATVMACQIQSLLDWPTELASLRQDICRLVLVGVRRPTPMRRRLWWGGVSGVLLCPATATSGELIGVLMIVWHGEGGAPEGAALASLMQAGKRAGRQIAAVLDLCEHLAARTPCPAGA
jgi:hypothetical protein